MSAAAETSAKELRTADANLLPISILPIKPARRLPRAEKAAYRPTSLEPLPIS
jgi:hypothetical protein